MGTSIDTPAPGSAPRYAEETQGAAQQTRQIIHDARNVVIAMRSSALLLAEGKTTLQDLRHITDIVHASDLLLGLFSEALLGSKDRMRQASLACSFSALIKPSLSSIAGEASRKGIKLNVCIAGDARSVYVPPRLISQVLVNLVHNGIKHTPRGQVDVILSMRCSPGTEHGLLSMCVQDSGGGIAPDALAAFFTQPAGESPPDGGLITHFSGMGIGLAGVAAIVKSLGGEITAAAREDSLGSRFVVNIPVLIDASSSTLEEPKFCALILSSNHCLCALVKSELGAALLAEGNVGNVNSATSLFYDLGHGRAPVLLVDVQTAGNAIGKVAAAARNLTSRLLLVALVQDNNANTYELVSMGYNVVVATEELGSLLVPLVNEALAILHPKPALITPLPMEQSQPAGAFCGLRVFVADDSTPHLEYCRHLLEAAGADVHVTSSGDDAFKSLVENRGAYDLALLDYFLPACTADKIIAKLRLAESAGARDKMPVIFMSADETCAANIANAEAVAFVAKPFGLDTLAAALHQARASGVARKMAPSGLSTEQCVAPQPQDDAPKVSPMAQRVVERFFHELPDEVVKIDLAIRNTEPDKVFDVVHRLRSAAAILDFTRLAQLCEEGERLSADPAKMTAWLSLFTSEADRLLLLSPQRRANGS